MDWFVRDFDTPEYFEIYRNKEMDAEEEGLALAYYLDLPPGSLVLDLPCGWGRLRPWLLEKGYRIVGGDLSPLNLARHKNEHPGNVVRLDLRRLPFRQGCAHGVFCAYTSWGYFASDEENLQQLSEFARVLKPEGVLLLDLTGRRHLKKLVAPVENRWYKVSNPPLSERVRWSLDDRRILTDRIFKGERFRHDIWVPTHEEVLHFLDAAGFQLQHTFGGLDGREWNPDAERWIYRAIKRA
jgi:SAM-dependent methyltransferase